MGPTTAAAAASPAALLPPRSFGFCATPPQFHLRTIKTPSSSSSSSLSTSPRRRSKPWEGEAIRRGSWRGVVRSSSTSSSSSSSPATGLPAALLFDCDGVLVDTERDGHRISFNETFAEVRSLQPPNLISELLFRILFMWISSYFVHMSLRFYQIHRRFIQICQS